MSVVCEDTKERARRRRGATATGDGTRISKKISHPPEVRTAACGASMRRASVGRQSGGATQMK